MSDEKKYPSRVVMGTVKRTKWGWSGNFGMSEITVAVSKKDPDQLVIWLQEKRVSENRGFRGNDRPYNQSAPAERTLQRPDYRPPPSRPEPPQDEAPWPEEPNF